MPLRKNEALKVYRWVRSRVTEEELKKLKEKYSDLDEVTVDSNIRMIEEATLCLIEG